MARHLAKTASASERPGVIPRTLPRLRALFTRSARDSTRPGMEPNPLKPHIFRRSEHPA